MTVFDFIEIKKELIATLEGETTDAGALVTDVKYAEGTVRSRKDGDYRKQGGKWVKIYSGEGRGASLAVTHAVKKIKAAQSVDELMDLVNANISRFYDKNGKLLPVVARLRDAVNESKARINAERKDKEKNIVNKNDEGDKIKNAYTKGFVQVDDLTYIVDKNKRPLVLSTEIENAIKCKEGIDNIKSKEVFTQAKNKVQEDIDDYIQKMTPRIEIWKKEGRIDDAIKQLSQEIKNLGGEISIDEFVKARQQEIISQLRNKVKDDKLFTTIDSRDISTLSNPEYFVKYRLNSRKVKYSELLKILKEKKTSDEDKKQPSTPAETPTQKIEKPNFLNGRFNGKVYGNAKYGYRVYVDGKEKSITAEQKKQVDDWQKQESEKKETQKETQKSVTNLENHLLDISLENSALDISNLASKAIKNPSNWEKYKKSDNVFSYPSNIAKMEKNANTPEEKAIIERLKTDKDFADTVNKTYIQLVENKMKQMKDEQSTKQGYDNRQTQIDDYIKANGTPDIVKNGFWNGKVYGSEKSGYSVYIDGKKKTLSEADKKQFGLK